MKRRLSLKRKNNNFVIPSTKLQNVTELKHPLHCVTPILKNINVIL